MANEFVGKTAIVTGTSGIGLGAALKLAREGAQVFCCGIDPAHNEAAMVAAKDLTLSVHAVDVSDERQVSDFIGAISSQISKLDVLVNAAAIQTYGTIETTDVAHWDRVIGVNLRSCYLMSHFAYPLMKNSGGASIIHVSSVQGHANQKGVLAYATTKGAIHALTRAMAVDCARDQVRVNSISPGSIRTPLLEFAAREATGPDGSIEDMIAEFGAAHPIGRVGTIEETSELIAFLAGSKSGFCTGGDYLIDGALLAGLSV